MRPPAWPATRCESPSVASTLFPSCCPPRAATRTAFGRLSTRPISIRLLTCTHPPTTAVISRRSWPYAPFKTRAGGADGAHVEQDDHRRGERDGVRARGREPTPARPLRPRRPRSHRQPRRLRHRQLRRLLDDRRRPAREDRKSTRLNSSHANISYAVFCLKKKKKKIERKSNNNKEKKRDSM